MRIDVNQCSEARSDQLDSRRPVEVDVYQVPCDARRKHSGALTAPLVARRVIRCSDVERRQERTKAASLTNRIGKQRIGGKHARTPRTDAPWHREPFGRNAVVHGHRDRNRQLWRE
jgi:hypothetical protein